MTTVEGAVDAAREADLRSAWEDMIADLPVGFIESFLLHGEDETWRIVTVWASKEAVTALRASGRPTARTMFERAGSAASLSTWTVEARVSAT